MFTPQDRPPDHWRPRPPGTGACQHLLVFFNGGFSKSPRVSNDDWMRTGGYPHDLTETRYENMTWLTSGSGDEKWGLQLPKSSWVWAGYGMIHQRIWVWSPSIGEAPRNRVVSRPVKMRSGRPRPPTRSTSWELRRGLCFWQCSTEPFLDSPI